MRRISNEDGHPAAARNWGRLALALIPLALGVAAIAWLSFYLGAHRASREVSQEDRAAMAVGAAVRPAGKFKFDMSRQTFCAGVTRADISGDVLRLYATNDCNVPLTGMDWHYEALSPNGTILDHGYLNHTSDNCPSPRLQGDSAECVFKGRYGGYLTIDDRVETYRVWTHPYSK